MSLIVAGVVLYVLLPSIYISAPEGSELIDSVPFNGVSTADTFTVLPSSIFMLFI